MQYSSYLVQSQNISNDCPLGVGKNVRNFVYDVVNSHGVVVMNAYSVLWNDKYP